MADLGQMAADYSRSLAAGAYDVRLRNEQAGEVVVASYVTNGETLALGFLVAPDDDLNKRRSRCLDWSMRKTKETYGG